MGYYLNNIGKFTQLVSSLVRGKNILFPLDDVRARYLYLGHPLVESKSGRKLVITIQRKWRYYGNLVNNTVELSMESEICSNMTHCSSFVSVNTFTQKFCNNHCITVGEIQMIPKDTIIITYIFTICNLIFHRYRSSITFVLLNFYLEYQVSCASI